MQTVCDHKYKLSEQGVYISKILLNIAMHA